MTTLRLSRAAVLVVHAGLSVGLILQLTLPWQLAVIIGLLISTLTREALDAGRWILGVVGAGGCVAITTDALGWGCGVPAGAALGFVLLVMSEPLRADPQLIRQTGGVSLASALVCWAVVVT